MSKYSSKDLSIVWKQATMTQHARTINGVEIEAILGESHSFGDTWFESLSTGMKRMNAVEIGGLYDDAVGGPNAQWNSPGTQGTLTIGWGGTKTVSGQAIIEKFTRQATLNEHTKYAVTLRPTGTQTEA